MASLVGEFMLADVLAAEGVESTTVAETSTLVAEEGDFFEGYENAPRTFMDLFRKLFTTRTLIGIVTTPIMGAGGIVGKVEDDKKKWKLKPVKRKVPSSQIEKQKEAETPVKKQKLNTLSDRLAFITGLKGNVLTSSQKIVNQYSSKGLHADFFDDPKQEVDGLLRDLQSQRNMDRISKNPSHGGKMEYNTHPLEHASDFNTNLRIPSMIPTTGMIRQA